MEKNVQLATDSMTLTPETLKNLGLKANDLPEIQAVAAMIVADDPMSVSQFGRNVADHASEYTDKLLDQVRNSDLDEAGAKLTELVSVAQSLNLKGFSNRRSKIPVIGRLIDRVSLRSKAVMTHFDTTKDQIERLIGEVEHTQSGIAERNSGLEQMIGAVREEHRLLGIHIAAGQQRLTELRGEVEQLRGKIGNDPAALQMVADMDALIANLDKRVGDLTALQQAAMQSLPTIRIIQANNQMLVDKFHTIREVTVPAWKRQFMLALSLNEQQNAVQLANKIDDTTNDLLKRNADLLHRNSVQTAKANQRLVIDVETLQQVQNMLVKTVEEVIKIQRDGSAQRKQAEKEIQGMRVDLQQRLGRTDNTKVLH